MSASITKSFLFIFEHAPHASLHAKEGLDFAFSCAAFEQKVDVLFIHDGVYQLLNNQNTKGIELKNHSASIEALNLYGIENCYYQEECAQKRGIEIKDLNPISKALSHQQNAKLLKTYDFIFTY